MHEIGKRAVTDGQVGLRDEPPTGEQLRDEGMARVSEGEARQAWLARGLEAIEALPHRYIFAGSDPRLLGEIGEPPHKNLWGVLFRKARVARLTLFFEARASEVPSRRASLTRYWMRWNVEEQGRELREQGL